MGIGHQPVDACVMSCMHTCVLALCVQAQDLATALGGPLLLSKGQVDVITDGQQSLVVTADGSPRRCGGQGDVLTGGELGLCYRAGNRATCATCASWHAC